MTKGNHKTGKNRGKGGKTTLALVKKNFPKRSEESDADYEDRAIEEAYWKLREKKNRTKVEDEEYKKIQKKFIAYWVAKKHGLAPTIADEDLRHAAIRLQEELSKEHGEITPLKHLLLDRLISAWSMASSYERLFQFAKYKINAEGDDTQLSYSHNENSMRLMQETRKGIESANDQIIRLSQTLRNLTAPPLQVKVRNAFFAQNQQINQHPTPKDLENYSEPKNNEETAS